MEWAEGNGRKKLFFIFLTLCIAKYNTKKKYMTRLWMEKKKKKYGDDWVLNRVKS
jgi:hypothetical protein